MNMSQENVKFEPIIIRLETAYEARAFLKIVDFFESGGDTDDLPTDVSKLLIELSDNLGQAYIPVVG